MQLLPETSLNALSSGPILGSHRARMDALLRHFHATGLTLAVCADSKHLGRKVGTLKPYVRRIGVAFPDYVPLALRPKKEPKPKRSRRVGQGAPLDPRKRTAG